MRRLRETGSATPGKIGGYRPMAISGEPCVWLLQRLAGLHLAVWSPNLPNVRCGITRNPDYIAPQFRKVVGVFRTFPLTP
jgi:hypothetical protein